MDLKIVPPNMRRFSVIEVDAAVENDELNIHIAFNRRMNHAERLKEWADLVADNLKNACNILAGRSHSFTLADFPLLTISYSGLDAVKRMVSGHPFGQGAHGIVFLPFPDWSCPSICSTLSQ